jgi:DHA3 family macrolide efflux protein-like MFS transporter
MLKDFSFYFRVFKNRSLMTLWTGVSISMLGDSFFNLAVMWVVYSTSESLFQTSLVQVVWHLGRILIGPIAGALSDKWDRKKIIVSLNILSAIVVGILAAIMQFNNGIITQIVVFSAIFILNSLNTFLGPAMFATIPDLVEKELLATQQGLFASLGSINTLIGGILAGLVISSMGAVWALYGDAVSFLIAALFASCVKIPPRKMQVSASRSVIGIFKDIVDGWKEIKGKPVIMSMLWLGLLINVGSMLGPLTVGLVDQQLGQGAFTLGALESCAVAGAIIGGILVGPIERRVGAGKLLCTGWALAAICQIFEGVSTSVYFTGGLFLIEQAFMVLAGASMGSVMAAIIP